VRHDLLVYDDADALARAAAAYVCEVSCAVATRDTPFTFAMSGGTSPWRMLQELILEDIDWARTRIFQVDERVAPQGSDLRNLTHIRAGLASTSVSIEAMGVDSPDLEAAAVQYARRLPERFDLVHLGLGPDGHTASLVPADPVLDVDDRLVALTLAYQGTRRMTLTYRALSRADQLLWLVTGVEKRTALAQLLDGDTSIPAGRVEAKRSLIMADKAAMSS